MSDSSSKCAIISLSYHFSMSMIENKVNIFDKFNTHIFNIFKNSAQLAFIACTKYNDLL